MKNFLRLFGVFFLCVLPVAAQTTQVTGTVTDASGLPYSGASMKVGLVFAGTPVSNPTVTINTLSQCKANGFGSAPCQVPFAPTNGPFTLDSSGNIPSGGITLQDNTQVTPRDTQWQFSVSIAPGVPPPSGTGPQSCSATLTISGASQSVTTNFSSCPLLTRSGGSKFDTNGIYIATNCAGAANCFQVFADVQVSENATYTLGSGTVTTIASDPVFVAGDVTKIDFAAGNCPGTVSNCSYDVAQGTIDVVNSAHSVHTTGNAFRNSSAVANDNVFFWGHDDGAQFVAAFAALFPLNLGLNQALPQPQKSLYLSCGMSFTSLQPFIEPTAAAGGNNGGILQGCGSGSPIIPLPKMNCNATGACLFADNTFNQLNPGRYLPGWHLKDITFWGGGVDVKDAAATFTTNVGILIQPMDTIDNVWLMGWMWNQAGTIGIDNLGGTAINSGSLAGGISACLGSGTGGTVSAWIGGDCGGSAGVSFTASSTANDVVSTDGMYINQSFTLGFGAQNAGGIWSDHGSHITESFRSTSAISLTFFHGSNIDQFGGGNSALTVSNGIVHLAATLVHGAGSPINQTGGTIFDDCGNGVLSAGGVPTITNLFGSCSVTGVADVIANHVLTSGWGTANVNTVGGSVNDVRFTISITGGAPAAGPVLTDTFATPYWGTPSSGCTLTQVGGTFAVLTNPLASALSRTGVAWTFTGTPVNGQSYIFARHCANS